MKKKVNIALIGCGSPHAHSSHLPQLKQMKDVSLVAVCDFNPEKLKEAQQKYNISKSYSDFNIMLAKEELDAVLVIVRPSYLKDIVIPCFKKGLAVSVEKPAGKNSQEAEQMLLAAKANNCINIVGLNRRFAPCVTNALKQLKGSVRNIVCHFYRPYESDCLPISEHIIHGLDMMRFLGGEIESSETQFSQREDGIYSGFTTMLKFKNNATGTFIASSFCHQKTELYEIHTDDMSIIIDYTTNDYKIYENDSIVSSAKFVDDESSYFENRHFIDCVKTNTMPVPNLEDALTIMQFCESINHERSL